MPRKAPGRRPRHLLRAITALRSMHVAHPAPYRAGRRHGGRSHRGVVVLSTGQYGGADRAAVLVDAGGSPGIVVRQAPAGGQHSTFTRSPKAGDQFAVNIYHAAKDTPLSPRLTGRSTPPGHHRRREELRPLTRDAARGGRSMSPRWRRFPTPEQGPPSGACRVALTVRAWREAGQQRRAQRQEDSYPITGPFPARSATTPALPH